MENPKTIIKVCPIGREGPWMFAIQIEELEEKWRERERENVKESNWNNVEPQRIGFAERKMEHKLCSVRRWKEYT